jgi:dolichol kinase/phosphoserine phosphatase
MESQQKPRLVVLDVEGVMVPKNRFFFESAKAMGLYRLVRVLFWGFLYEAGILKFESALRHIYWELRGAPVAKLLEVFGRIAATSQLHNLCEQLKERNCKIALISSGIPILAMEKLSMSLCADYLFGVEVIQRDGLLTGEIWGDAITKNGKLKILNCILAQESLTAADVVAVADDRNNSCIFLPQALKIGVNPDFVIRLKADRVVVGKLQNVLPIIDGKPHRRSFPKANDLVREDIHAAGFFMPIIATMIGVPAVSAIIILIAAVYTVSELYRLEGKSLPLISSITRHAASQTELFGFAAAPLYFAFGIVATLLLYPAQAGGAAIAMFCLGDSAASLFGGMISTSLPFNKGKTWEGSLAGFFFAFLAGSFFVPPLYAVAGAAIAMTVEVMPLPINDNVSVPIITGAALTLLI